MPTSFRPHCPNQALLFSINLRERVPEDHLARQVNDLAGSLDLSASCAPTRATAGTTRSASRR